MTVNLFVNMLDDHGRSRTRRVRHPHPDARGAAAPTPAPSGPSCTPSASTTCPGTAHSSWPGSTPRAAPERTCRPISGVTKQAVSQVIDILVNRGYLDPEPRPRRPPPDHPGAHRTRAAGRRRRVARRRGGRPTSCRSGCRRSRSRPCDRCCSPWPRSRCRPGHRNREEAAGPPVPSVQPDLPGAGSGRRPGPLLGPRLRHLRLRRRRRVRLRQPRRHRAAPGCRPRPRPAHHASAYLYVRDADALYEEWSRPGIGGRTRPVGPRPTSSARARTPIRTGT